jgi:hypothetical protein
MCVIGGTMSPMQLIEPSHALRPSLGPLLRSTIVGGVLLMGGVILAWLSYTTPIVSRLTPAVVRPEPDQLLVGGIIWGIALVAPPCFGFAGGVRLALVAASVLRRPDLGAVRRSASLGDEYVLAPSILLPDGRRVANIVIGPFGIALLHEPPSPSATRRKGKSWEMRRADGRWVPLENPVDRAVRDAERIRSWMAADDRDFLVKVYPAVVTSDKTLNRTSVCAVIAEQQIEPWLASLPPQRSFSSIRREDLVERVRSVA